MTRTLLICDDAPFMRALIRNVLSKHGYDVVGEAATGIQAVEQYQQLQPDLVTMDVVMPDMTGIDALRQIKEIDPTARLLVCSAIGQERMVRQAMDAGANGFLVKPFEPADLQNAADQVFAAASPAERAP